MNEPSSPVRKSRDSASQPPAPRQQLPGRRDDASGGDRPPPQRFRISGRTYLILLAAFALVNAFFYTEQAINNFRSQSPQIRITQSELIGQAKAGNVKSASLGENGISGDFKRPFTVGKTHYKRYTAPMLPELVAPTNAVLESHGVRVSIVPSVTPIWVTLLSYLFTSLPLLLLLGLILYGTRAARSQTQGIFGFGQSRGKLYTEERPHTTFGDVAGVDAAKAELREIVDFLKEPAKYHRLGARIPKGVLLVGPPGTGKTLLARAVAGEANVPFLAISATEFVELFVGVGASRVRDLFERAKASAPSIVFIDEMDAIGGHRGARGPVGGGSNDEREQTLNQMLVSMDGFEPNDAVIVLGATNRPDVLDRALLRPGRFDRQVVVDPPDRKGREAILKIHTAKIPLGPDVDLAALAGMTPGMSGADLANLANEAALSAARSGESQVTQRDFTLALDRITLGLEGSPLMIEEERRLVAFHEGGHALVAFMLPNVDPVNRITITPRGRSLGATQFLPVDDRRNYRRDYLINRMAVGMGGRAAEEIACDEITSGAQNDLQMVTHIARTMVTQLGMAEEVGPTYLGGAGDDALNGGAYNPFEQKEYSDETAARIDLAVSRLVEEARERARSILTEHRQALDAVAQALMKEESLNREEFTAIVNAHRGPGEPPHPVPTGTPTPIGEDPQVIEPAVTG